MKNNNKVAMVLLNYGMILVLILTFIIFSFAAPNFLKMSTILTILKQVAIIGIISVGMTFVMLTGGIDLSVGSVAGATAVVAAILMKNYNLPIILTCVAALVIASAYGCICGFCVTKLNMPPMIATLGVMTSLRGLAYIVTGGLPVFGFNKSFGDFAKGTFCGIPYTVFLLVAVFVVAIFTLSKTTLGRYLYGVGGNEEASRLSGINVTRVKMIAYGISGFLSGVAGLVLLSRTNSGQPSAGSGYEMDAITCTVLGGISLTGGEGKLGMVTVGVLLMGILNTGMIMCKIDDYVQQLVKGIVLIVAVAFSQYSRKVRSKMISVS